MKRRVKVEPEPIDVGDRVEVQWFDAHGDGGWMPADEIQTTPHHIVSFGAVLENNEHGLTIVQSVDMDSGNVDHYLHTPWVNVTKVTVF